MRHETGSLSLTTRLAAAALIGFAATAAFVPAVLAAGTPVRPLSGARLLHALQRGGYALVMRHASSPPQPPDRATADPGNVKLERQLDQSGCDSALALGAALRKWRIPVGEVWSSPTYRALQTVRYAALGRPVLWPQLGDAGRDMQPDTEGKRSAWLRQAVAHPPRAGTNTFIVTQAPNIDGAFGPLAAGMTAGEALVFRPRAHGPAVLVARIKITDWTGLQTLK